MGFKQMVFVVLIAGCVPSAAFAQRAFVPLNAAEIDLAKRALVTSGPVRQPPLRDRQRRASRRGERRGAGRPAGRRHSLRLRDQ